MQRTTTLSATEAIANVEAYLAQQYAKRRRVPVVEKKTPYDGIVVFVAMLAIVLITQIGK
jgi:hypothetical protein